VYFPQKDNMTKTHLDLSLKTFALADDDSDDADLFMEALREINPEIAVEAAANGQELIEKMTNGQFRLPDIIFLDINMPEMNGWDCLSELKKSRSLSNVPVVMYSTSSNMSDKAKAVRLGASYFYTKPDTFRELKTFLKRLIDNPQDVIKN
jgi:CheY-like chemotaxis protein